MRRWLWAVVALGCRQGGGVGDSVTGLPVAIDDAYTTTEDQAVDVPVRDNDVDPDLLAVVEIDDTTTLGTVALTEDGVVRYDPAAAFQILGDGELGSDGFDYAVSDGVATAWATVTLTVTGLNDAPIAVGDAATVVEGGTVTVGAAAGVLANDTDLEGDPLAASVLAPPRGGTVALAADGGFTYTHTDVAVTTDTFVYTVSDGEASGTATVTVTVTPVNDPPVAVPDRADATEDAPITVDVRDNDTDPERDALTVTAVGAAATGAASLSGAEVRYDPAGAFEHLDDGETATDTFAYTVTDGTTSVQGVVTVTVHGRNDAPVAEADAVRVPEGGTVTVNAADGLLANDADVDGDSLAAQLTTPPARGTASVQASGAYTYTHDGSETTSDALGYQVGDGTAWSTSSLAITVTPVDDPPVAVDDAVSTSEDAGRDIAVLGNDADPEGATLQLVSVTASGLLGTATKQGSQVRYEPNGRFEGLGVGDSALEVFTYRMTDGAHPVDGRVWVTVTGVNDAPVARADGAIVSEGGAVSGNVLGNDSDPDGDALTAAIATGAAHGTASVDAVGGWTYTHDGSETAADSFTYTAGDGRTSSTGTVTITVTPVNDPPVVVLGTTGDVTVEALGGVPVTLAPGLTLSDADDTLLRGATVALAQRASGSEVLGASAAGTSLSVAWDDTTATLLVAGTASVAAYEQVLRTVSFTSGPGAALAPDRVATFTVTDGDDEGSATATIRFAGGTLCAAFRHSQSYSGFGFLSDAWGATSPGLGAEGNRCVGLAITELRAEVWPSASASAPTLVTGWIQVPDNPFVVGTENAIFTAAPHTISLTVRSGFGSVGAGSIGGTHCTPQSNSYQQGSALCVSDGVGYQSVMGELNSGVYNHRIWMCAPNAWCGGPDPAEILVYVR